MNLAITSVTKRYGSTKALDAVNLSLQPRVIYGLLGRNGAGKTTLLNVMAGRLVPNLGTVMLDGLPLANSESGLSHIYLMDDSWPYPPYESIGAVLKRVGRFYGKVDEALVDRMLEAFHFTRKTRYSGLSLGQRQLVKFIVALSVPVDFLLLDEPVNGVDAAGRELCYRFLLESYGERERTVVIATHLISEVERVVEQVALIDGGKVIEEFSADELGGRGVVLTGDDRSLRSVVLDRGLTVLATRRVGTLSSVAVRGSLGGRDLPAGVIASPLDLQSYFVAVTQTCEEPMESVESVEGAEGAEGVEVVESVGTIQDPDVDEQGERSAS